MTRIHRLFAGGALLFCACLGLQGIAVAQTSDEECLQDMLRLVSPDRDGLRVSLSIGPPFGTVIQWADLDDAQTTCAAAAGTDTLDFGVSLSGDYRDVVDRQLNFFAPSGGEVGAADRNRVRMLWNNANVEFTGQVAGEVNLSNNGGLLAYDPALGTWVQENAGLPMYLGHTDVKAFAISPAVPGRMVCGLEDRLNRGLWYRSGTDADWVRLAPELFPDLALAELQITVCAFSPEDPETFVVGTDKRGLYLTRDAGETFVQFRDVFSDVGSWEQRSVGAISWDGADRFFVAIDQLGLFRSSDDLGSFSLLEAFLVPEFFPPAGASVAPRVTQLIDDGSGRILAGVEDFGVYESLNDGLDWSWRWTQILARPNAIDVQSLIVDPEDPNVMIACTDGLGVFRTTDGGLDWDQVLPEGSSYPDEPPEAGLNAVSVTWSPELSAFVAALEGVGLLTSADGATWDDDVLPPLPITSLTGIHATPGGDRALRVATYDGGIYVPGTPLDLSNTLMKNITDAEYRDLDFGLTIAFSEGVVDSLDSFALKLQDFQGYGVWRSETGSTSDMELIGLYDKNNPESCIQGYCGQVGYYTLPSCYADKRAACFDFSDPDTVRFFDDHVYDGFQYYYAVTTFDYGNTALVSPQSLASAQVFSSRFEGDELTPFAGPGNRVRFDVNMDAQPAKGGTEIFAYPNPLRNTSKGFSQAEDGVEVSFVNLPPESRIQVFTLNGDLVGDLSPELQEGHSIKWITRNDDGELLASGVYIYKVEMPEQDDYFGKLVIIR